MVIADSTIFTK